LNEEVITFTPVGEILYSGIVETPVFGAG
jgi:hypothetical protein